MSAPLIAPSHRSRCREVARWATSSPTWRGRPPNPWWCRRRPKRRRRRTVQSYKSSIQELNTPSSPYNRRRWIGGNPCKERTKLYSTLSELPNALKPSQKDAAPPLGPPLLWENCGEVVARACPMFKNKNKFLGTMGQLLQIEIFISPGLSTTPQADALWFDSSHLSLWFLLLSSSSQGIMVMVNSFFLYFFFSFVFFFFVFVTRLCFCTFGRIVK